MNCTLTYITVPAADGFPLVATLFVPERENGTVVLFSPATAVARRLYAPLAQYLAGLGFIAVTWDWRGTGDSRPASLRGFGGSMRTWAESDLEGVIEWAQRAFPHRRLTAIGHSFGGQAFGLTPAAIRFERLVTIAAQNGYVGYWPATSRLGLRLLWHAALPGLVRIAGFWPGRLLRLGEDLPAGVALEWARWCRSPQYHGSFQGYARLRAPMLAFSIEDDGIAPARAVDALHRAYSGCSVVRRHVSPTQLGVTRVGHFGVFRAGRTPSVWGDIGAWLTDRQHHEVASYTSVRLGSPDTPARPAYVPVAASGGAPGPTYPA